MASVQRVLQPSVEYAMIECMALDTDTGGPSNLLTQLALSGDKVTGRVKAGLTSYVLMTSAAGVARSAWQKGRARLEYSVTINADDDIYPEVQRAVVERMPSTRRRSVTARTSRGGGLTRPFHEIYHDGGKPQDRSLSVFYDGSRQSIVIDGHKIAVTIVKPQPMGVITLDEGKRPPKVDQLMFTCYGAAARDAVVKFLDEITEESNKAQHQPDFYLASRWGDWQRRRDLPRRSLDTIVLRDDQRDSLVDDLAQFRSSSAMYDKLGIPYHRGYLLHGPPGTGKTSIARALATHFGLDIYYMPLSDIAADANLIQLVAGVGPQSLLLLEDIDVLHAAKSRDDEKDKVTLSGLLNALDGVATPHGLVVVMTTNHLEKLDPALIRPGRVDRLELIDHLDDDQLSRLVRMFLGYTPDLPPLGGLKVTPAEVVDIVKANITDPDAALKALYGMLSDSVDVAA